AGTVYTDTNVVNGTTYYYVVAASNACGNSADSVQVSATPTAPPPTPPAAPTNLRATGARLKVNLSWTQSSGSGITENRIYRSTTDGGLYSWIASLAATSSFQDTQVTCRIRY